jgi:PAS domain S-box-containing protein
LDSRQINDIELPLQRAVAENREIPSMELEIKLPSGKRWFAEASGAPMHDIEGNVIGDVAITMDITERKQAEKEHERLLDIIQQDKNRLVSLIDNIVDEIWFADSQENFTLVNTSGRREFGISDNEKIKVEKFISNLDIYRPDGSLRLIEEDLALRALRNEAVTGYEHIVRMPATGELCHRQINSSPVRDPKGNIIGSISVVRDVTEIKKIEKALQESETKYCGLFETVQEAFYINQLIYDEQGNVIDWIFEDLNPAGFKFLGLKDINETKGKRGSEVFGCERAAFHLSMIERARLSNTVVTFQYHSPYVDKELLISYVVNDNRLIITQIDVTEQKKAEMKLKQTVDNLDNLVRERTTELETAEKTLKLKIEELIHSNEELEQFAYISSHDLQEPLRMITSYLQLLQRKYRGNLDDEADMYIHFAVDGLPVCKI